MKRIQHEAKELDTIRCDSGIKNPFKHAVFAVYAFQYYLRICEIDKLVEKYKNVSSQKLDFVKDLQRSALQLTYHFVFPQLREYEKRLHFLSNKYRSILQRKNFNCTYVYDDPFLELTFIDQLKKKKKIKLSINGSPILAEIENSLRFAWTLFFALNAHLDLNDYKIRQLITKGRPDKHLFYYAYFEFFLKGNRLRQSKLSLKHALEAANDKYRVYDTSASDWPDIFERLHTNFKKWVNSQTPFLVKILDKS